MRNLNVAFYILDELPCLHCDALKRITQSRLNILNWNFSVVILDIKSHNIYNWMFSWFEVSESFLFNLYWTF